MRRNLSGIYIFDKFEGEDKKQPTCIEDCSESKRNEWIESLDKETLINLSKMLCDTIKNIGNKFDIVANYEEN